MKTLVLWFRSLPLSASTPLQHRRYQTDLLAVGAVTGSWSYLLPNVTAQGMYFQRPSICYCHLPFSFPTLNSLQRHPHKYFLVFFLFSHNLYLSTPASSSHNADHFLTARRLSLTPCLLRDLALPFQQSVPTSKSEY